MGWLTKLLGRKDEETAYDGPVDTAATLIAATIDLDDNCSQWTLAGLDKFRPAPRLANEAIKIAVTKEYVGGKYTLTIDGKDVPLTWGERCELERAVGRWRGRQDEMTRQSVLETTAQRVKDYVRKTA